MRQANYQANDANEAAQEGAGRMLGAVHQAEVARAPFGRLFAALPSWTLTSQHHGVLMP